ncbi:MAG: dUTP diphosphatase [Holdemanella biformis]|nr:dUTP diphosphatase [Holdemanella biformis]MEE0473143.1 dUTP diphosphatase [Holdemanella biformis]
MTSTELIKDMLGRQKAYDVEVFKKHNVDYVSKSQLESALFDELGELMHSQKADWCWWKFTQEPKNEAKVFEEYIDVVHFALMYEIKFGSGCYMDEDIKWNYNKLKTDLGFGQAYAFSCVISLTRDDNVLAYVIALGLHLGYSIEEIYNEYIRKNEINKERLKEGY